MESFFSKSTVNITKELQKAIQALNFDQTQKIYWNQNECIFLENFLTSEFIEHYLLPEMEQLRSQVHRNYIPKFKKGGSISYHLMKEHAPNFVALYQSPDFINFICRLFKTSVKLCPESDPHGCALYFYTEPGDHIAFHYDKSFYKGNRYTVLLGLVQKSKDCKLVCHLNKNEPHKPKHELTLSTEPGSMVIFNGNKLYHAVTPLEKGGERIVLTLEYVSNTEMKPIQRFISNIKDAIAYFGFRALFKKRRPIETKF